VKDVISVPAGRERRTFLIEADPAFMGELLTLADEAREQAATAFLRGHDIQGAAYLAFAEWMTRCATGEAA
jgi:hypothetical protein